MNSDKLKKYSDEVPAEIKSVLKAVSNEVRLGILIGLLKNGRMTFNDMKESFGLESSNLTHHLTILQDGNLIKNRLEKKSGRISSYYDPTDIPEKFLKSIFDIVSSSESYEKSIIKNDNLKSMENKLDEMESLDRIKSNWLLDKMFQLVDDVNSSGIRRPQARTTMGKK